MKFRKKPVVIDAIQWTGTNVDEIIGFTFAQVDTYRKDFKTQHESIVPGGILVIPTSEGDHNANPNDWIIKGVKGEFYPCKPDIFEATYEKVE